MIHCYSSRTTTKLTTLTEGRRSTFISNSSAEVESRSLLYYSFTFTCHGFSLFLSKPRRTFHRSLARIDRQPLTSIIHHATSSVCSNYRTRTWYFNLLVRSSRPILFESRVIRPAYSLSLCLSSRPFVTFHGTERERERERRPSRFAFENNALWCVCNRDFLPVLPSFFVFFCFAFFFRLYFVPRREGRERIFDEKLIARWVCQTLESGGEMLFKDNWIEGKRSVFLVHHAIIDRSIMAGERYKQSEKKLSF